MCLKIKQLEQKLAYLKLFPLKICNAWSIGTSSVESRNGRFMSKNEDGQCKLRQRFIMNI